MISEERQKKFELICNLEPNVVYITKGANKEIKNRIHLHIANPSNKPVMYRDAVSKIYAVAITEDGKKAVSGSEDGAIKVWDLTEKKKWEWELWPVIEHCVLDLTEKKKLFEFRDHKELVSSIAITPDGSKAVSASWDDTVGVWDLINQKKIFTLKGHFGWVNSVAVTPNGKMAVSGSVDKTLKIWDLQTGKCSLTLLNHNSPIQAVALREDGKIAVTASQDGTLTVWDLEKVEEPVILGGHSDPVSAVAITPDCRKAVSASQDGTLKVWDLEKRQGPVNLEGHSDPVSAVAIAPDGRKAVSISSDRTLKVWDLERYEEILTLKGHSDVVYAVTDNTLRIWGLRDFCYTVRDFDESIAEEQKSNCYHLSKFYIWFNLEDSGKNSSMPGALTTKEYAADITISADDESRWFCEKFSDPKIGPYWILYPKERVLMGPMESCTFEIDDIVSENEGMTWMNIRYHVLGHKDETVKIPIYKKMPLFEVPCDLYVAGKMGIGTRTPSLALDVQGSIYCKEKLGIGTRTPSQVLDVQGNIRCDGNLGIKTDPKDLPIAIKDYNTGFDLREVGNIKRLTFHVGKSPELLCIDQNGKLGIGTSSPQQRLDVQGNIYCKDNLGIGTSDPQQRLDVRGSIYCRDNLGIGTTSPQQRLDVQGNIYCRDHLGIGTSSPSQMLDVKGNIRCDGNLGIQTEPKKLPLAIKNYNTGFDLREMGNIRRLTFHVWTGPELLCVDQNGKLGIGTSEPKLPLCIGDRDTGIQYHEAEGEHALWFHVWSSEQRIVLGINDKEETWVRKDKLHYWSH